MKLTMEELVAGIKDGTYKLYTPESVVELLNNAYRVGIEQGINEATTCHRAPETLEEYLGV